MELGKTAGFRPDDPKLVQTFNLAMDATGADLSALCILSIRHGLDAALAELLETRSAAQAKLATKFEPKTRQ